MSVSSHLALSIKPTYVLSCLLGKATDFSFTFFSPLLQCPPHELPKQYTVLTHCLVLYVQCPAWLNWTVWELSQRKRDLLVILILSTGHIRWSVFLLCCPVVFFCFFFAIITKILPFSSLSSPRAFPSLFFWTVRLSYSVWVSAAGVQVIYPQPTQTGQMARPLSCC